MLSVDKIQEYLVESTYSSLLDTEKSLLNGFKSWFNQIPV